MKVSVIIPVKNEDPELLIRVLHNLTKGYYKDELEVLLINDGSMNPDGSFMPIREILPRVIANRVEVIDNKKQFGVGYCMDRGVERATGDVIVLAGADTFPQRSWLQYVKNTVSDDILACGVSVGLQPGNYDINQEGLYYRYGAKMLYTMTVEDLPKLSPLRKDPNYRDILEAKWQPKQSDEPYEISCVYGAFYWMTKKTYDRIHVWDTEEGKQFRGHMRWGCLEPHLSLKAKVYGVKCMMYPDFKVGHCFGRINDIYTVRSVRDDLKFWNKLFVAHTLLDDELRDEVLAWPHHSLNLSQAKAYIKRNFEYVQSIRERNKLEGKLISKND
jgi:glycosyltransferase involved in cell wall biosynthesis